MRCVAIAIIFSTTSSFAQQKANPYVVEIKGQQINPAPNAQQWFDSVLKKNPTQSVQVLLQFQELPSEFQKQQLATNGVTLLDYIPNMVYVAVLHFPLKNLDVTALGIRSITEFKKEWKIDDRIINEFNLRSGKRAVVLLSFVPQTSLNEIEQLLKQHEGAVTDKRFAAVNTYTVQLPQNKIYELAKDVLVKYISLPANIQPLNSDARSSSGANLLSAPLAPGGKNLDGGGVSVGVGDNVSAIYHVDARDRVINFNPANATMHGIHTTLTVGGKGIMDPRTQGMAPSVKILNHIYDLVWAQTPYMYADYNMTITNNSYAAVLGDPVYAGTYDQYSQMLDQFQKDYPYVQHVFASGNDGLLQFNSFPAGYGTVTGGYQPAKNILTVGAMTKYDTLWPKTSRGPVKDGRLKPEIMGYGFSIYSGDIYDMYGHSNGTSMSSPVVAGNLALIEQRYKQLSGNQNIPSDLLKTLAMNGATDMGKPGPDFTHGYGLINTYRSIQMLDNNWFNIDSVNNGATKTHNIIIPPNTAQVKIMLYWHDDPASPLSSTALINNLDLEANSGGTSYLPWILDPSAGNVTNNAVRGIDNRNNSEQITIDNPSAGNCSITVKGTLLPAGKQRYVLAYDFVPAAVKIKFPVAGSKLPANDSLHIYWDASDNPNPFTLEYSDNNGSSWNVLSTNIPATQKYFYWKTPNISSAQCSLRISRNNTSMQDAGGRFTINPEPILQLSNDQCPGYISISWNSIPNVSGYKVMRKIGDDLLPVDTVTTTNYIFSGLSLDSLQYVAVQPMFGAISGWRSKAVRRLPNDGNCSGNISDGDLMADSILSPHSGRLLTSAALTSNETLSLRIRNLDDVAVSNYRISYSINGNWQSQISSMPIPANGSIIINIPGQNFAAAGIYKIRFAVENLAMTDLVKSNDTITRFIQQLNNAPVNINASFTDDFENAPAFSVLKDTMGVFANDHWDYFNSTDSGRLRSFVSSDVLITGQRSLSMDLLLNKNDNQNYLTGTFNLQGYNAATTEARVEFDYKLHGKPKFLAGNEVWIRGNDTAPWLNIYTFDTSETPGKIINTGSLSLTNTLAIAGQDFSSNFQVRIGQRDTSVIAMNEYGNGLTLDNFKLYSVKNDVQLLAILSPSKFNCSIDSASLTIQVYNSDNLPQDTIELFYRMDNGAVVRDTIFSLAAKDTVTHTFNAKLNTLSIGQHTLDVWLNAKGDSYLPNDSILNFRFRNQPNITSFPYLENFETNDGNWFADGFNSSWQYGTPNSLRLKKAASGTKVWTTNLSGNYNDNEASYLYSPCFELSGLQNPMLSFSLSTHIENCGNTLCDAAYVEYSDDGTNWKKLGATGEGYNWYGDQQVWNDSSLRWRVASIPLPKDVPSLKLRFVLRSDAGAAWDGIAIDDIHIFDLKHPVYNGASVKVSNIVNSGGWTDFVSGNDILAQMHSNANTGNTDVYLYNHSYVLNPVLRHYNLQRNYVLQSAQNAEDSVSIRLFITDQEVVKLVNDQNCDTCARADDAYRLGITQYSDAKKNRENGSLTDNVNGSYIFIPYTAIQWVPYEKGYYAQTTVASFSEFWFNTSVPSKGRNTIMLYPNPVTNNKLNVMWNGVPGTELKLVMYDVVGRKVYEAASFSNDFDVKTTFILPDLETGIYTVRCFIDDQINTYKVLVTD